MVTSGILAGKRSVWVS